MAITQTATTDAPTGPAGPTATASRSSTGLLTRWKAALVALWTAMVAGKTIREAFDEAAEAAWDEDAVRMAQSVGPTQIVGIGISIGAGGIVLNQMSGIDLVNNSSGVVDVSAIFTTAGNALILASVGMIIAAAAMILGFFGRGGM